MELHTHFSRRVGAGTDPVLGTDAVPTGLPAVGVGADLLGNILRTIHPFVADNPVQRIALFYRYTGVGPAPDVPLLVYCYDRGTNSWFQLGPAITLVEGVVGFVDSIAGILPMQAMPSAANMAAGGSPGDSYSSFEVCLVPAAPVGAPAGTYTFAALFDASLAGGEHVIVDQLPPTLGQKAAAQSLSVVNASDDPSSVAIGTTADAKVDTDAVGTISSKVRGMVSRLVELAGLATTPGTVTAITPSDVTDTTAATAKGILVGVGGTLVIDGVVGGSAITVTAVAGQYVPIRAAKVKAASTATGLVGLS